MLSNINLKTFLDGINDAMIIADEDSNIVFVNNSFTKLFGYSKEDVTKLHIEDLMSIDQKKHHKNMLKSFIINSEKSRQMMSRMAIPCLKQNKDLFKAQISISNVLLDGKKYGVATIQDFTELHNKIDDLNNISNTDPLTLLYNRRFLNAVLEPDSRFIKNAEEIGVFFLDLNKFKLLNDTHGHECGDFILKTISSRLKELLRYDDLAFRLGGDEFLILVQLNNKEEKETLEKIALKMHKKIIEPIEFKDISMNIGTSIGVGVYKPHLNDIKTIIKLADKAMYTAKTNSVPFAFIENIDL